MTTKFILILTIISAIYSATAHTKQGYPSVSLAAQSGYGVNEGQKFIGIGGTESAPGGNSVSAAAVFGMGFGDSNENIGVEVDLVISSVNASDGGFADDGFFGLKLHKTIDNLSSVAVGVEGAVQWGDAKNDDPSYYVAYTKIFLLPKALVASIGVGDGRFIPTNDNSNYKGFVSAAYIFHPKVSVIADYTANILKLGVSFVPIDDEPLTVSIYADDVDEREDDTKASMSVSYSF